MSDINLKLDSQVAAILGYHISKTGYIEYQVDHITSDWEKYSPSTDWGQGGQIIEDYMINLKFLKTSRLWRASIGVYKATSEYPLVAAMTCFVEANTLANFDVGSPGICYKDFEHLVTLTPY